MSKANKLIRIVTLCEECGAEASDSLKHKVVPAGELMDGWCEGSGGSVVDLTRQEAIDIVSERTAFNDDVEVSEWHSIFGAYIADAILARGTMMKLKDGRWVEKPDWSSTP